MKRQVFSIFVTLFTQQIIYFLFSLKKSFIFSEKSFIFPKKSFIFPEKSFISPNNCLFSPIQWKSPKQNLALCATIYNFWGEKWFSKIWGGGKWFLKKIYNFAVSLSESKNLVYYLRVRYLYREARSWWVNLTLTRATFS